MHEKHTRVQKAHRDKSLHGRRDKFNDGVPNKPAAMLIF